MIWLYQQEIVQSQGLEEMSKLHHRRTGMFWALALESALAIGEAQAQTQALKPAGERISVFFFNEELAGTGATAPDVTLHASAIQTSEHGPASVWINGTELFVHDRLGPVEIVDIEPSAAMLRVSSDQGPSRLVRLAMNQSLSLTDLAVREGQPAAGIQAVLPKTRLP